MSSPGTALRSPTVVTVGETMVLLAAPDGESLETAAAVDLHVAGAESTVARYLARLGHRAAWIGAVGDDPFGRRIVAALAADGVDVAAVRVDPLAPTGVYFKDRTAGGATVVHYYRAGSAAAASGGDVLDTAVVREARVLHLSGITPALSSSCDALVHDALLTRRGGTAMVSFDVNHRPGLWTADDAAPVLRRYANAADVVFVGLDEAARLWRARTAADVRRLLPGPPRLVVKDAAREATSFVGDNPPVTVVTPPVDVVEAVGAGDAFAAGYLHAMLLDWPEAERLTVGHRLAAASLSTRGDVGPVPPDLVRAGRSVRTATVSARSDELAPDGATREEPR